MRLFRVVLTCGVLLGAAVPALADVTLFVGSTTTPSNRQAKGIAAGLTMVVVGFELEYASTVTERAHAAPSLTTGMGNVLVQTPIAIKGLRPYLTIGAGAYRESLDTRQETNVGLNTGGGLKISLLGSVRARVDYRAFKLKGSPLHSTVHRLYAGLNLAF